MSDFICEHCGISKAECTCSAVKICKCCENHVMKKLNNLAKSQIDIKELASKRFVVNNINDLIDKVEGTL